MEDLQTNKTPQCSNFTTFNHKIRMKMFNRRIVISTMMKRESLNGRLKAVTVKKRRNLMRMTRVKR